jgi:metallo-beta-lactamase class B
MNSNRISCDRAGRLFFVFWLGLTFSQAARAQVPAAAAAGPAQASASDLLKTMNQPVAPFHLIGNIYYVGASDITSYLIVTPGGDILLDGGFKETAPQIEANIQTLGFRLADVKIILNTHAHLDHAGGISEMKRATGAQFFAMETDVPALTAGTAYPVATPDKIIHDGDTVTQGGVTLTAHLTPGHTPGCTTWTMVTQDSGRPYNVVFVGSATVLPNYKLVDRTEAKATYPGIESDYETTFRVLKSLPCDVFLAAHGTMYSLTQKRDALSKNPAQNPFIDPWGYQVYIAHAETVFQTELQKERAGQ